MPDRSNVSPEAEALARLWWAEVNDNDFDRGGIVQRRYLAAAQRAIDAGWTPPDRHEDIARDIAALIYPGEKFDPRHAEDGDWDFDAELLAAVRRMDLRRGDQIGPTTQPVNEGDPSTWPDITATEALIAAAYAWVDRITDPPFQWADDEDLAVIAAVRAHREAHDG